MPLPPMGAVWVARNKDRFDEQHNVGIGILSFKVTTEDSQGALLVVELAHQTKGGPARHFHSEQDEWFYVVEGEYVIEVEQERFRLTPGDSLFALRQVPHCWAFAGDESGRLAIVLTPAGQMEAFFRELSKAKAMPPQDPAFWHTYGMELVGPPLAIEEAG